MKLVDIVGDVVCCNKWLVVCDVDVVVLCID